MLSSYILAQQDVNISNLIDSSVIKGKLFVEKHVNGIIKSRGYKIKNIKNGTWYYYDDRGAIHHKVIYKMGKIYFEKYYNHKNNEKITFWNDSIH